MTEPVAGTKCDMVGLGVRVTVTKAYKMPLMKHRALWLRKGEAALRYGFDMCSGWGHCS